ncbi:MAG TPA: GreA/GreB family elongation factor [Mucilaginibacter sp.]|jgi:transcription elongation GreA/GreB family factor
MRSIPLILTREDYKLLTDQYDSLTIPAFNKQKLYQELKDAKIVRKQCMPLNVVSQNAKVLIWNIRKNQTFSIQIVPENSSNRGTNKVLITDPIVIALLGYPTGAVTEWEMEDGINQLKVMSVEQEKEDQYS